jgi:hypothetical protein
MALVPDLRLVFLTHKIKVHIPSRSHPEQTDQAAANWREEAQVE